MILTRERVIISRIKYRKYLVSSHLHKMLLIKNQITLKKLLLLDCRITVKASKILKGNQE